MLFSLGQQFYCSTLYIYSITNIEHSLLFQQYSKLHYQYIYIYIYIYIICFLLFCTDYTDDLALLANTPTHTESLLHSLKQAAGSIGLHVNADKTECMSFNQKGDISTLNSGSLKLGDKFSYLGRSISSTENDNNMHLAKTWTAIDWLLIIWKSDLSNEIKCNFF